MTTREEALEYGMTFPDTYIDTPFSDQNWVLVRYSGNRKAFLWSYEMNGQICLNLKTDPEKGRFLRASYPAVQPAYHQNKEHWITVVLDHSMEDSLIRSLIRESYFLISDSPTKRIYEAVKKIPKGYVATYADVAALAGDPKMARAVGNALHKNSDPEHIPCFRVVNAKGELADEFVFGGPRAQENLLRAEGIEVVNGRVNLEKYQWKAPGSF